MAPWVHHAALYLACGATEPAMAVSAHSRNDRWRERRQEIDGARPVEI
jgi:hypothetical protein